MRGKKLPAIALAFALIFTLAVCSGASTASAAGASFPAKMITIYNSSSAGSPADVMARQLAKSIEQLTGQTVVVENATGGNGGIMFGSVQAKPADGYTWGSFTAGQISQLLSGLDKTFPIDSFQFVSNIQSDVFALNVAQDAPWNTLAELIAWAKENPGKLTIGGQGSGTSGYLAAAVFAKGAGINMVYMPYDGAADTARNLLGKHVLSGFLGPTAAKEFIEAGQIKMLAVTGDKRVSQRPQVPTFAEFGCSVPFSQYRGIYVKKGVDPATVQAISDLIRKATLTDSFVAYMKSIDAGDAYMDHATFDAHVRADYETVGAVMREFKK